MRLVHTNRFKRDYDDLPEPIKRSTDKALRFLATNPRHRSLRAKKMEGQQDAEGREIWEARVTRGYRFTFAIEGDTYILRRVGPHDIERRP